MLPSLLYIINYKNRKRSASLFTRSGARALDFQNKTLNTKNKIARNKKGMVRF